MARKETGIQLQAKKLQNTTYKTNNTIQNFDLPLRHNYPEQTIILIDGEGYRIKTKKYIKSNAQGKPCYKYFIETDKPKKEADYDEL